MPIAQCFAAKIIFIHFCLHHYCFMRGKAPFCTQPWLYDGFVIYSTYFSSENCKFSFFHFNHYSLWGKPLLTLSTLMSSSSSSLILSYYCQPFLAFCHPLVAINHCHSSSTIHRLPYPHPSVTASKFYSFVLPSVLLLNVFNFWYFYFFIYMYIVYIMYTEFIIHGMAALLLPTMMFLESDALCCHLGFW